MTVIILPDIDLSMYSVGEQAKKVNSEYTEFLLSTAGAQPDLNEVAAEAMDVIQALKGYLEMQGIDMRQANQRHIAKMKAGGTHGNIVLIEPKGTSGHGYRRHRWTQDDIHEIRRRYLGGKTFKSIAKDYGVSPDTIRARYHHGLPLSLQGGNANG